MSEKQKNHFSGMPSNSENLRYLKPGVKSRFLFSKPWRLALPKLLTALFLNFELAYFPTSFYWISSTYLISTRNSRNVRVCLMWFFHRNFWEVTRGGMVSDTPRSTYKWRGDSCLWLFQLQISCMCLVLEFIFGILDRSQFLIFIPNCHRFSFSWLRYRICRD